MQIRKWVRGLSLLLFAAALSRIIVGAILAKPDSLARELFNSICIGIFAYFLNRYAFAINRFLKNESIGNLEESFERQSDFWRATGVLAVVFAVVHFMFMF